MLSEFDFEIQYIPGETNRFADALSWIYSDEAKGVVQASSKYVDDRDELKTYQSVQVQPIYIETYLLSLMNAVTQHSSCLADKPIPHYKDMRDHKLKEDSASHSQVMAKEPEMKVDKPSPKAADVTEGQAEKVSCEPENWLFKVSSNWGISFPGCTQG